MFSSFDRSNWHHHHMITSGWVRFHTVIRTSERPYVRAPVNVRMSVRIICMETDLLLYHGSLLNDGCFRQPTNYALTCADKLHCLLVSELGKWELSQPEASYFVDSAISQPVVAFGKFAFPLWLLSGVLESFWSVSTSFWVSCRGTSRGTTGHSQVIVYHQTWSTVGRAASTGIHIRPVALHIYTQATRDVPSPLAFWHLSDVQQLCRRLCTCMSQVQIIVNRCVGPRYK